MVSEPLRPREPSPASAVNPIMKPTKTYQSKFIAFKEAIAQLGQSAKQAGQLLCEMLDEDSNTFEFILKECPHATLSWLESLEAIGRGRLDERLLLDSSPAAHRAIAQALPIKEQTRLLETSIPVAVRENGGIRIESKRMQDIKAYEAPRIIRDGKILTPEQQTVIIKEELSNRAARNVRYIIEGDSVEFLSHSRFKMSELEEILGKLKQTATDALEGDLKKAQVA